MPSTSSSHISRDKSITSQPADDSHSRTATPMAIPRTREPVPPPLPPPSEPGFLAEISACKGWQWGNRPNDVDFGRPATVKPGSSLLGESLRRQGKEHDDHIYEPCDQQRRNSSISTITVGQDHDMPDDNLTNEDRDVTPPIATANTELKGERELRQKNLELSSQTYDKHLLSRIGGPNPPKRPSLPYTPGRAQDSGHMVPNGVEPRNNSVHALSLLERRHGSVDSSSSIRWPPSGPFSPRVAAFWTEHGASESNYTSRHGSVTSGDTGSHRGSYDHSMFVNDDFYMGEGQMSNLYIDDQSPGSPKAGSKRRASSPPREREDRSSVSSASGQSEMHQSRMMQQQPNRTSPVSRFHLDRSSVSSASSIGPRHGSLGSSLGVASVPSSATSYGSGRASPSLVSPLVDVDFRNVAMSGGPNGVKASPVATHHQRTFSESAPSVARKPSTDSIPRSRNGSLSHLQGVYICECCPKKPRKFDTEEELRLHENEKQYTCAYCLNRFKNKNEAERHQNSLHLRRSSWSCAALSGIEAAFHSSSSANGSDVCGYCGQEFPNPAQWDVRAEHLNHVHKFGECNQAKKFFRADHFRQHLKHSHQGTSGKWTNVLENACMKDEPVPEKRVSPVAVSIPTSQPTLVVTTKGLSGPGPPASTTETIEETPHDS